MSEAIYTSSRGVGKKERSGRKRMEEKERERERGEGKEGKCSNQRYHACTLLLISTVVRRFVSEIEVILLYVYKM